MNECKGPLAGDEEIEAMITLAQKFQGLDPEAIRRVLVWANDRFAANAPIARDEPSPAEPPKLIEAPPAAPTYETAADFFHATHARTDAERVLAMAYWLQALQNLKEWPSGPVNDELKNLGYPVANICEVLTRLSKRTPSLVVQTSKSGKSKQSRKTYKLTEAGLRAARQLIGGAFVEPMAS